jgi:3-dehydroquinate synthetase
MPLVQLPTSLVAQADSAIGGKTGINHPRAKNLIGAFHPPALTLVDTAFLATLPERELRSGWAEVVKTALVADPELLRYLIEHAEALRSLEPEPLGRAVGRCAALKLEIVTEDPREDGRRAVLNYGHTIGHAVEAAGGYGVWLHGEAVAVGMRGAAMIASELGLLSPEAAKAQERALDAFRLPGAAPGVDVERALEAMKLDKKARGGRMRWVLLREPGSPELRTDVPPELVRRVVEECVR